MPQLGLRLSLSHLSVLAANTQGGTLPTTRLADAGAIALIGRDGTAQITYLADTGAIAITGRDGTIKIGVKADSGAIALTGFDALGGGADSGILTLAGADARYKIGIKADIGLTQLTGIDSQYKTGVKADSGAIALTGFDARIKISIAADTGGITTSGIDAEWEEDFVANYVENVAINSGSLNSLAFSIAGKIIWIDAPVTSIAKTCTLQSLAADGTTWISTGVTWTTSTSVNTVINSETLAKVAGKTGPGLNNFRLSYDSSLGSTTTHIIRSRT